jgi:N-acetylneuraminic acid mutarotase
MPDLSACFRGYKKRTAHSALRPDHAGARAQNGPGRTLRAAGRGLAALALVTLTAGFDSCGGGGNAPNYVLAGSVSGLLPGHSVVLQNYGSDTITVSANGSFQFSTPLAGGAPYSVTALTQPTGENCSTVNGSGTGTVGPGNKVTVACTTTSYTIGGAVTGLSAGHSLVLQDNGGNATTVSSNTTFTFSAVIAYQSPYAVTVATQPTGQSCAVTDGSGTTPAANVTNVAVVCTTTVANAGLWTWESGSNMPEFTGVYGTQGTAAPGNVPGGREAAFSWTDNAGNLWMFGGIGAGNSGVGGTFNDLWRYSPSSGLWAWMSGADTLDAQSVYGTKGTAAVGNVPSAREGGASWIDGAGNLWLFGGGGFDSTGSNDLGLSDLWRYSPSNGLWTWMNGPTVGNLAGVYGTQGTAAPSNVPGGRTGVVSFKDGAGNFWLFGGLGFDSIANGNSSLNDLWRYSTSTGMWTWMGGSNQGNATGVYGTQGTAAAGNVPGARFGAVSWTDAGGNFWLFGGRGYDSAGKVGMLNDLWRYSPGTGQWTWMSGSTLQGAPGVYGTLGTAAAGNVPGARQDAVSWIDNAGNLWLFGYDSFDSTGNISSVGNDLWRYNPSTGLWTWISGSNIEGAPGVYGTEGTAAPGNVPGGRDTASSWADSDGNFWLFGGYVPDASHNDAALNDLWKYVPLVP